MADPKSNAHSRPVAHVPPGRSLADLPPREPIPPPSGAAKPRNSRITLRELLIGEGERAYLIPFFKEMSERKKKGEWPKMWAFYIANLSGDVDSMDAANRKYCDKIVNDLNNAYLESQDL